MRQNAPCNRWHVVALEQPNIAPHTGSALNVERAFRRLIMKRLLVVLAAVALLSGAEVAGQSKRGSLQGVWQTVEVTPSGPGARTIRIPEPRPNLMIVTAKHYSRVEVQAEAPRPIPADVAKASADELRAVWGPFVGEAGTYEVTNGNVITMRPLAAKNPAAMAPGASITYSYKLDGNTIWVTQQRNQNGPFLNPVTIKAVRVE
jgi:hypothetical protein